MEAMGKKVGIKHLEARKEVVHAYSSHEKEVEFFGH